MFIFTLKINSKNSQKKSIKNLNVDISVFMILTYQSVHDNLVFIAGFLSRFLLCVRGRGIFSR